MAGCASCLHKNVHTNVCSDCLGGTHFKPRNRTVADKIRAMTDEELAKWLNHMQTDAYDRGLLEGRIVDYPNNYSTWLGWLRQEATDDKTAL